jgi:hypothetical protein
MVMCLWVPYLCWVTHGGSGESSIGSKTKLFEIFFARVPEFKTFLKIPGFQFFLNPSFSPKVPCDITPVKLFFENGGLLAYSSVSKLLILVFDAHRIPPRPAGACNTLKEPAGGLWGILN